MSIAIKRVYEPPAPSDGTRLLVDRLWPRGMRKEDAQVDHWMKDIAPSDALRKWFHHDPTHWDEFDRRYRAELADKGDLLDEIRALAAKGPVTLVYGAKDEANNQAVVLARLLNN